jgi:hypothetical protein
VVGKFNGSYFDLANGGALSPLSDRDLKFAVKVAQFSANGATVQIVNEPYEFLTIGTPAVYYFGGELAYQEFGNTSANVKYIGAGTVNVSSTNTVLLGTGTTFTSNFAAGGGDYIVLTDGTLGNTDVIPVASVTNNTILTLTRTPKFNNTSGVYKRTVVGAVFNYTPLTSTLILTDSNATANIHLQTDAATGYLISAPGTLYANNDAITVTGGTTNATARAIVNASGAIVGIRIANTGSGFNANSTLTLTISSNTGSGANIVPSLGASYIVGSVSTANAQLFSINDMSVHQFDDELYQQLPSGGSITASHNFSISNSSGYFVVNANKAPTTVPGLNTLLTYQGEIMSRTHEVLNPSGLYPIGNGDVRSSYILANISVNTQGAIFETPLLYEEKLDVFVLTNQINNTAIQEELPQGGLAQSRHITTTINFANNQNAEDLRVYVDAWKPVGTDIKVYAKIENSADSDTFTTKYWTPLIQLSPNTSVFSSGTNANNIVEYTYGFPSVPVITGTHTGFLTSFGNNVVFGNTTGISGGSLIQIVNPLFSNTNYQVGVALTVNSTAIVLDQPISVTGVVGGGMNINTLQYNFTAFNNINNDNVVRYYDSSLASHDGFCTMALKVVMEANTPNFVPTIVALRSVGLSA